MAKKINDCLLDVLNKLSLIKKTIKSNSALSFIGQAEELIFCAIKEEKYFMQEKK